MADKKISELVSITGSATAADDYFVVVDTSGAVTYKISREELNNAIEQDVLENISITNLTSDLNTNGNDIKFGDNDKAIFGAGSDLQIYHDGADSYITESATGSLYIGADSTIALTDAAVTQNKAQFITGGAVNLFHNNAQKFATTASGCDITGAISANKGSAGVLATFTDGVNSNFVVETSSLLTTIGNGGGSAALALKANNTEAMRIDSGGNVNIGSAADAGNTLRYFDVSNANTGASAGSIIRLITSNAAGSGTTTGELVKYKSGLLALVNSEPSATAQTAFYVAGAERMRIDSSGNVGIGTSSPQSIVHIDQGASNDAQLTLETHSAGDSKIVFSQGQTAGNWAVGYDDGGGVTENSLSFAYKSDGYPSLSGQNKMLLTPAGNVGIGGSPSQKLDVYAGGKLYLRRPDNATGTLIYDDGVGTVIDAANNTPIRFAGVGVEGMRYHNGKLGINNTNPSFPLVVSGKAANHCSAFVTATNGYAAALFYNASNTNVGQIQINASSTAYVTTSDYRLKTDVTYDWDATTRLKQLKPARFEWIADGDDAVPVDGFLAHEVQDVVPEAISGTKDGMRDEEYTVSAATGDIYTPAVEATYDEDGVELTTAIDEVIHSADVEQPEELAEGQQWRETTAAIMGTRSVPDFQGIDQSKLVPLLVKTIQELEARITALETS